MSSSRQSKQQTPTDLPVSDRILATVAEKEEASPLEFDGLLSEVIDPDALDTLFQHGDASKRVEFIYLGYRVRVESDGEVTVSVQDT